MLDNNIYVYISSRHFIFIMVTDKDSRNFIYIDKLGNTFKIRTACVILICHEQVVMIKDYKNELEFPGGKVENIDNNIYDTLGREMWEELFLQGKHSGEYLENWKEVKKDILNNPSIKSNESWIYIMSKVSNPRMRSELFKRSGSELKTIYYVTTIPKSIANYLERECGAFLVDIKAFQSARSMANNCTAKHIELIVKNNSYKIRSRELFCLPRSIF